MEGQYLHCAFVNFVFGSTTRSKWSHTLEIFRLALGFVGGAPATTHGMVWPSCVADRTRSRTAALRRRPGGEEAVVVISDGEEGEDDAVVDGRGGGEELEEGEIEEEEEQYTEDDRPAPTPTTTTSDEEEEEPPPPPPPPPLKPVVGKRRYGRLDDNDDAERKGSKSRLPGRGIGVDERRRKEVIDISDDSSGVGDEDGAALYYGGGGRKRMVGGKRRRSSEFGRLEAPMLWEKKKRWKPSVSVKTRGKKVRQLGADSDSSSSTSWSWRCWVSPTSGIDGVGDLYIG